MSRQNGSIINHLLKNWPKSTVAVYSWLKGKGVYRQLAETYFRGGWIERVGQGAFKRAGENIEWTGGLYTLQTQLGMSVHPAGRTALELQGLAHYLPASLKQQRVVLFGSEKQKLPAWFKNYNWGTNLRYVMTGLFTAYIIQGLTKYNTGYYEITISSPERAALEFCYDVPIRESFDELDQIMSGLTTLRPRMLQELLEACTSIKAKRLFMYLAEKHAHVWVGKLDPGKIDFGIGKRSLCVGGHYDSKYKIVVPK